MSTRRELLRDMFAFFALSTGLAKTKLILADADDAEWESTFTPTLTIVMNGTGVFTIGEHAPLPPGEYKGVLSVVDVQNPARYVLSYYLEGEPTHGSEKEERDQPFPLSAQRPSFDDVPS